MARSTLSSSTLTERRLEIRDTLRKAWRIAFPAFMASLLAFGMNLINYILLALFQDYRSIAAYGIVSAYTTLAAGIFMPIAAATGFVLERTIQSNDPYREQEVVNTAMLSAVLVGVLSTVFAVLIAPAYAWQVVTPEEIKEMTIRFLRLFSVNFIPIIYFGVTTNILMRADDPKAPILAEISAIALHISFGYIFVGLFKMGIYGCAFSAILSQSIAALINTHLILQKRRRTPVRVPVRIHWNIVKELFLEERPAVFTAILGGIFAIFLQYFIDELGVVSIAGFTLFFLFQEFLFLPFKGFISSARNLAAAQKDDGITPRLRRTLDAILVIGILYGLILIPESKLIGPPIFMFLSHYDPNVTVIAMRLVNLLSSFYFFCPIIFVISAGLEGLGRNRLVMGFNIGFDYVIRFLILVLAANLIQGELSIVLCYPFSWAISAGAFGIYFFATFSGSSRDKYSL